MCSGVCCKWCVGGKIRNGSRSVHITTGSQLPNSVYMVSHGLRAAKNISKRKRASKLLQVFGELGMALSAGTVAS